jgi:hypothetical protein
MDALARDPVADARTRAQVSAHAESCARCAARLADELALTRGLRALRSKSEAAEAPARVESALLAALLARAASLASAEGAGVTRVGNTQDAGGGGASTPAGYNNVSTLAGRSVARRWSWAKTVAAAALAAAAALTLFMLIPPGMSVNAPGKAAGTPAMRESVAQAGRTIQQDEQAISTTGDDPAATASAAAGIDENRIQRAPLVARAANHARAVEAKFGAGGGPPTRRGVPEDEAAEEIATDFIPLMQGGRFTQGEEGHLVRVELPRSALASFGLPVNAERAGGRVKADVLLGEDGLARAIRFVR